MWYSNTIVVNRLIVHSLLRDLDPSKGGGNDAITNKMLKLVANSLAGPLTKLFQRIITENTFPDAWKLGTIVPVYKNKGSRSQIANYRPITLLNSFSKLLEKVVYFL